jgi:hypothetical protein
LNALRKVADGSRVFESVVVLGTSDVLSGAGSTTLLAVRPDGYIGMRCDRDHLGALEHYQTLLTSQSSAVAK